MNERIIRLPRGIVLHVHSRDDDERKNLPSAGNFKACDRMPKRLGRFKCRGDKMKIPA